MRSLTSKLTLGFLAISIASISVIVVLTHLSTNREFDRFISDRYTAELVEECARYYKENGSWDGIQEARIGFGVDQSRPGGEHPLSYAIANTKGRIVRESYQYKMGMMVNQEALEDAAPIRNNEALIGYLLIEQRLDRTDPMQDEFLRRLNRSLFLSAIGTILLALILGTIFSRNITRPIRELTKATHTMSDGNLGQQVPVRSRDELGELAQSFNKMSTDLARAFDLRKQMTADIAHELRTPLSLILGHAEGVHDGVLKPTRENFEIIREEAERLEHLVNDLRTLTLADAGELSMEFQLVNVNDFMRDIHTHYLTLFHQKRITLNLETAPVILKANLDPGRFAQVLNNILDNALRHTPENGRVELKTQLTENRIQLSVKDSGEGVTSEEASHLFDRFYRVDESRTRHDGGSGLGLAIAKSIVEMHKGRIWAESEKGKGLRVVIELPRA